MIYKSILTIWYIRRNSLWIRHDNVTEILITKSNEHYYLTQSKRKSPSNSGASSWRYLDLWCTSIGSDLYSHIWIPVCFMQWVAGKKAITKCFAINFTTWKKIMFLHVGKKLNRVSLSETRYIKNKCLRFYKCIFLCALTLWQKQNK